MERYGCRKHAERVKPSPASVVPFGIRLEVLHQLLQKERRGIVEHCSQCSERHLCHEACSVYICESVCELPAITRVNLPEYKSSQAYRRQSRAHGTEEIGGTH